MLKFKKPAKILKKSKKEVEDFISDISDDDELDKNIEKDILNKDFNENILNYLKVNKTYINPLLEPNKNKIITNTFSLNYNTSLYVQSPPPPPIIKKDEKNENLLNNLVELDKKLDDILNFIINNNLSSEIVDPKIKNHINLLRDIIDSKAGIIHDELSYRFGKKPLYRNFFVDKTYIFDPQQNIENNIKEDYDYNKKIFI